MHGMLIRRSFFAMVLIAGLAPMPVALAGDLNEVATVLSYHEPRMAFYERSPRRIVNLMRDAVKSACRSEQPAPWLCDGTPLSYLRGVYVTGSKSSNGFVCRGGQWSQRYYTPDMLNYEEPEGEHVCLPVFCEGETGKYQLGEW